MSFPRAFKMRRQVIENERKQCKSEITMVNSQEKFFIGHNFLLETFDFSHCKRCLDQDACVKHGHIYVGDRRLIMFMLVTALRCWFEVLVTDLSHLKTTIREKGINMIAPSKSSNWHHQKVTNITMSPTSLCPFSNRLEGFFETILKTLMIQRLSSIGSMA